MGRSYLFECPKCFYKARVSGRAERGVHFAVQTILCRDCKELYDAVTALKVSDDPNGKPPLQSRFKRRAPEEPPDMESVVNRLALLSAKKLKWVQFKLTCPVEPKHRIQVWTDPGKCPRCGVFLERNALAFRLWD